MAHDDNLAGTQIVAMYEALKAASTNLSSTFMNMVVMARACASKAQQAITGSKTSTGGLKRTG